MSAPYSLTQGLVGPYQSCAAGAAGSSTATFSIPNTALYSIQWSCQVPTVVGGGGASGLLQDAMSPSRHVAGSEAALEKPVDRVESGDWRGVTECSSAGLLRRRVRKCRRNRPSLEDRHE